MVNEFLNQSDSSNQEKVSTLVTKFSIFILVPVFNVKNSTSYFESADVKLTSEMKQCRMLKSQYSTFFLDNLELYL